MKGYYRKRGNTWSYTVDIGKDLTGKRQQRTKSGFKTKKEAQQSANELMNQLNKGINITSSGQLLNEYLYSWLETYAKRKVRETTFTNYKRAIDSRIIPFLGNYRLNEITMQHGESFVNHLLEENLSPRYIEYLMVLLKGALDRAVLWELIIKNPLKHIEIPRDRRKKGLSVWSQDEVNTFLLHAKFGDYMYYALFLLTLYTGMRRGEVLGLRWQDVDLENKKVKVEQTLIYDEKGFRFGEPKTESSKRQIAIDDYVCQELKRHKKNQNEFKLLLGGGYEDYGLVFANHEGKPIYPRNLTDHFNRAIKKASVPRIRFHDLRHTHATLLMKMGENPKIVSERLGHSKINTTLDVYSHVTSDMQESTATKFGDFLRGSVVN